MATVATGSSAQSSPLHVDGKFYFLYALCTVLLFPIHESAHFAAYRLMGIRTRMTLNSVSPLAGGHRKPAAEIAGPVMNLVVAATSWLLWRSGRPPRRLWAALALASTMMRLVIYVLIVAVALVTGSGLKLGNDEPIAARLWGLPSLIFVAAFALPFTFLLWSIARGIDGRPWRKRLQICGLAAVTLVVGLLIGNVVDPWLFPKP